MDARRLRACAIRVSRALTLLAVMALVAACGGGSGGGAASTAPTAGPSPVPGADTGTGGGGGATPTPVGGLPSGLALPVSPDALSLRGVVNPFGVVRWSLDRPEVGHPGIDIPVDEGTPFVAAGDGSILSIEPATDGLPGDDVQILLSPGAIEGTGWVFEYEHVTLEAPLSVGSQVSRGQTLRQKRDISGLYESFRVI